MGVGGGAHARLGVREAPLVGEQHVEQHQRSFVAWIVDQDGLELTGGVGVEYWTSWLALGDQMPTIAAGVAQPVLVISGDRDWNVPPAQTEAFGAALTNADVEIAVVPCVTHALNCLATADLRAITPADIGRTLDPHLVEAIVAFLLARV